MSQELQNTAQAIIKPGKGILAADESTGTIAKRFESIGAECSEQTRRDYREMLFRTTGALQNHISGIILFDETIRQEAADGTPLVQLMQEAGSIPGIKVDTGAKALAGAPEEKVTEGLDGLRERLADYYAMGARFAKWRAVIDIARNGHRRIPSAYCIKANAHALARYAALCQEAKLVPIVEPEVLMDGDHDIDRCLQVTEAVLNAVFGELHEQRVVLEGTLLKPNMVLSGKLCANQASVDEVAEKTLQCFARTVPAAIPGIVFLSGGQSDEQATAHLNAINQAKSASGTRYPWALSFSYGRALQAAPLKAWSGNNGNIPSAQAAFAHRARMNGLATKGEWGPELENQAA